MSKIQTSRINIFTESPVSIGADQSDALSPYADFVVSDDGISIYYIDQDKLSDALGENEQLLDKYLAGVSEMENNRSRFRLKEFITNNLNQDIGRFARLEVDNRGYEANKYQTVSPIVKTADRPFIPGSSIKGAIRTALLYQWLTETQYGKQILGRAFQTVYQCDQILAGIAHLKAKKKRNIRLNGHEFRKLREVEREVRYKLERILPEQELFGNINDKNNIPPQSQFIRVSDSEAFSAKDLIFCRAERIRLKPQSGRRSPRARIASIPQPREAISEDKWSNFEIGLRQGDFRDGLKHLKDNGINGLLKTIHAFSKACLGFELDNLEYAEDMPDRAAHSKLINFYTEKYNRANKGEVFMRIGMGKTIFDNSLTLAFHHYAEDHHPDGEEAYLKFRRVVHEVGMKSDFFPVTRTVLKPQNIPLGWVKLELT